MVTPLLKKDGLDVDIFGNYRPISNLHTISKIVERVYMTRIAAHVKQSVLGPLLFTLYVAPIANIISSFGVNHTQFADDTQLYAALKDENATSMLADCSSVVQHTHG